MNSRCITVMLALFLVVLTAKPGLAQVVINSGDPVITTISATVDNNFDVTISDVNFGTIGVTGDAVDTATMTISPVGVITEDTAGDARIVHPTGTGTAGNVLVTNAFADTLFYVDYAVGADLNCGLCSGAQPDLLIVDVLDNLNAPNVGTGSVAGTLATQGEATTNNLGTLDFDVGVSIQTEADPAVYEAGSYAGEVDVTFSY